MLSRVERAKRRACPTGAAAQRSKVIASIVFVTFYARRESHLFRGRQESRRLGVSACSKRLCLEPWLRAGFDSANSRGTC